MGKERLISNATLINVLQIVRVISQLSINSPWTVKQRRFVFSSEMYLHDTRKVNYEIEDGGKKEYINFTFKMPCTARQSDTHL
jgi:hypothetical protein